jgi:hypothetical protein
MCGTVATMETNVHKAIFKIFKREAIPVITDPAAAARWPELAVVSAMAHGESEQGLAIAAAVLPALEGLDDERAMFYGDLVLISLNPPARRTLEAMMEQSGFVEKFVAMGRAYVAAKTHAEAVLTILRVRGLDVPETARERILAERDLARLQRWIQRAVVVASVDELLDEPKLLKTA